MRRWTWLLAVVGLVVACGGMHEDGPHSEGPDERLVSTEWLSDHKDDDNVVVVDTQPTDQYMSGHIPGAVSASFSPEEYESHGQDVSYGGGLDLFSDRDADIPFQDGPPEQIQDAARSLGINRDSTVIAYDHGPDFRAARFLFTLHSHGFADVRILNGGFTKWTAEERPTTEEVPEVERGDFVAEQLNEETIATTDYVAATREDDGVKLISGLLPSWHYGGDLPYSRPGHIPNTVHIPMGYFFNSDGTWKDPSSIRPLFEVMGVDEDDEIITYCGGNPLSACTYFTAKFALGYDKVRNYTGSLVAWLDDSRDLPLHTYDNPQMLRDTDWISWWAGERMQKLVHDPPARVIDVRSVDSHESGHIPWSVNVPLSTGEEVTQNTVDDWAHTLGEVGIDRTIEAVVCDDQITPRVTAMVWLLEYMGHPDVSVCAEGISGWEENDSLTTDPTIIAESTHPLDVAVHPTTFEPDTDGGVILNSSEDSRIDNRFSRTWVVAGSEVPEELSVDQYVSVPSSQHLTENGAMKSAWELWTLYDDAGVNKFTEVVVAADSVAQASVNYFALRLLGFPMVRIWVPGGSLGP